MKKVSEHYWIAFCVGKNTETNEVLASCLTFWARNRFQALTAIREMLPAQENWTRSDGTTYPHQLWRLEQCRPSEAESKAAFFMQTFCDAAGISPASLELDS